MYKIEPRYLGDGVYASFDGYHIVLDLRGQNNFTKIALEPAVMNALSTYNAYVADRIHDANREATLMGEEDDH